MNRKNLLSGGAFLTVGTIIQALTGLASQLVLMRLLLPENFGEFATILSAASLSQVLLSFRLNIQIIRLSDVELTAQRRELYQAALVWETAVAASVSLIWLGAAGLLSAYALILIASLTVAQWMSLHVAFLERKLSYRRIATIETGSQVVGHLIAMACVLVGLGPASLYFRELIIVLLRLGAFGRMGALAPPRLRLPTRKKVRQLIVETRSLWLDGVLDNGFARMIVLAAAGTGGSHGAGIFAQSHRLAITPHQILSPVVMRMSGNLFSRITDHALRRTLLLRLLGASLVLLLPVAALAVMFADPLIPKIIGEHWRGAVSTIMAMAGVIVFLSAFELLRGYCLSRHLIRVIILGRAIQYAVFVAACVMATLAGSPIVVLAWGLSAAYALAFAALFAGILGWSANDDQPDSPKSPAR